MADWYDSSRQHLIPTYDRIPIHFVSGQGVYLKDGEGNRYLDALGGIAVNILGYRHPRLVDCVQNQAEAVHHVSNLYEIESQVRLAELLNELTFTSALFFCNSGAEANESAIKLARKYAHVHGDGTGKPVVLSFEGSFHGRTQGALAATGQAKYKQNFGPLPEGFVHVPFNDMEAVRDAAESHNLAAILFESIQGEGGVRPADGQFLRDLRAFCDREDVLLMADEVQAGMGRTGSFFGFESSTIRPDVVTLAKGLGGGFPIGAMMVDRSLQDVLEPGDHASTFGGNPFVTSVACRVLTTLQKENLIPNARERGKQLIEGLESLASTSDRIHKPRGRGLMVGVPCAESVNSGDVMKAAREQGLIVGIAGGNTVRLVPPLILTESETNDLLNRFESALQSL